MGRFSDMVEQGKLICLPFIWPAERLVSIDELLMPSKRKKEERKKKSDVDE